MDILEQAQNNLEQAQKFVHYRKLCLGYGVGSMSFTNQGWIRHFETLSFMKDMDDERYGEAEDIEDEEIDFNVDMFGDSLSIYDLDLEHYEQMIRIALEWNKGVKIQVEFCEHIEGFEGICIGFSSLYKKFFKVYTLQIILTKDDLGIDINIYDENTKEQLHDRISNENKLKASEYLKANKFIS